MTIKSASTLAVLVTLFSFSDASVIRRLLSTEEPEPEPLISMPEGTGEPEPEPMETPSPTDSATLPPYVVPPAKFTVQAGQSHTCMIWEGYGIKCWGLNSVGQLGYGDMNHRGNAPNTMGPNLPYISLGAGFRPEKVVVGSRVSCALSEDQDIKCWGDGNFAQTGQESSAPTLTPEPVSIDMDGAVGNLYYGGFTGGAVTNNRKRIKLWGSNFAGQLGYDRVGALADSRYLGDQAGELGSNLDFLDLGSNFRILQASFGELHSCAILRKIGPRRGNGNKRNVLKCWGDNSFGQLGYGDSQSRTGSAQMGNALKAVKLGSGFDPEMVSVGEGFTCVVSDKGKLKCFGTNVNGQLGLGDDVLAVGISPSDMGGNLKRVDLGNRFRVAQIEAGRDFVCALSTRNKIKCFGDNFFGQLGQGDTDTRGLAPGTMGNDLPTVKLGADFVPAQITVGDAHACALSTTNKLKCWGENGAGALGLEDNVNRGTISGQMGDDLPEVVVF